MIIIERKHKGGAGGTMVWHLKKWMEKYSIIQFSIHTPGCRTRGWKDSMFSLLLRKNSFGFGSRINIPSRRLETGGAGSWIYKLSAPHHTEVSAFRPTKRIMIQWSVKRSTPFTILCESFPPKRPVRPEREMHWISFPGASIMRVMSRVHVELNGNSRTMRPALRPVFGSRKFGHHLLCCFNNGWLYRAPLVVVLVFFEKEKIKHGKSLFARWLFYCSALPAQ